MSPNPFEDRKPETPGEIVVNGVRKHWRKLVVGAFVCLVIASMGIVIGKLLDYNKTLSKEVVRLAEEAQPDIEYLAEPEEMELKHQILLMQRVAGMDEILVVSRKTKASRKLDGGVLRAQISRESGAEHFFSDPKKGPVGDVKLSPTNDLGITMQHLEGQEWKEYKAGGRVWRGSMYAIRVDLKVQEANILAGWCHLRQKMWNYSPSFKASGEKWLYEDELWHAVLKYNGGGAAAKAYKLDVRKRYETRFRKMYVEKE